MLRERRVVPIAQGRRGPLPPLRRSVTIIPGVVGASVQPQLHPDKSEDGEAGQCTGKGAGPPESGRPLTGEAFERIQGGSQEVDRRHLETPSQLQRCLGHRQQGVDDIIIDDERVKARGLANDNVIEYPDGAGDKLQSPRDPIRRLAVDLAR